MRYGDKNTIHQTGEVNVEIDGTTGKVVSVWFRCMALPFTQHLVGAERAKEMLYMYESIKPNIIAIEMED